MTLQQRLAEYVRACFTGLYVETHEHEDAMLEIARLCAEQNWRLATWDIERGLTVGAGGSHGSPTEDSSATDPLAAIRSVHALADGENPGLLVLTNFHRFMGSAEVVQALVQAVITGKQRRTFIVILSPVVQLPVELEKLFAVITHELPDRDQIEQIARGIGTKDGELPDGEDLNTVLDAAAGLTRYEAESAFSLSLVRHGRITPQAIWDLKTQTLKKSGLLQLHRSTESFADLGGLDALKAFCFRSLKRPGTSSSTLVRPRGVLLLGVPGTGKSAFAKALGRETGRPTLMLDVGALMGSLVGQTESNVRRALNIADAMAPCILFCDEIEKALSGVASSGQTDSGVSARLFGSLLTWLNDHTSDVYFVGTCNDVSKLPPEFARAERFDGVFFLDLPADKQKQQIWQMYLRAFGLDAEQELPRDDGWTGAEIRACCRLAALLGIPLIEAAHNVVPVSTTAAESVERLRGWAEGRCLSADDPGTYQRDARASSGARSGARRRVTRKTPNN